MRGRLLYGYCVRDGAVRVDPLPAAIVCAVLAVPTVRGRLGLAARLLRHLQRGCDSAEAVKCRVQRIRRHRADYACGRARTDLPPCAALILSGPARPPAYTARNPSPAGDRPARPTSPKRQRTTKPG